jgi:hypothetical protein
MALPDATAEELKDLADRLGAISIRVTFYTAPGEWRHLEVRHAGLWDEAPDGWTVEITQTSL